MTSNEIPQESIHALLMWFEGTSSVEKLTNEKIAELLLEHVWCQYPIDNPAGWLIGEAINRLDPNMRDVTRVIEGDEPME